MHDEVIAARDAILAYGRDDFLYLHRAIIIARCLRWEFSDEYVLGEFRFERLVVGDH